MGTIYGSLAGNVIGTIYFLLFQIFGIILGRFFLKKKDAALVLLFGSVLGSVLLQWLPALYAFFVGFTITAHLLALASCAIAVVLLYVFLPARRQVSRQPITRSPHEPDGTADFGGRQHKLLRTLFPATSPAKRKKMLKQHLPFLLLCTATFALFCVMLSTHTLLPKEDGFHTGQCTYGDMNMHLGFITSLAKQGAFPPEYSIAPGNKLCYPFLCDSISASVYLFGASLRYAYMLPMYFAVLQVFAGFYLLAYSWLRKAAKACLAWFLFFYNGGLAFVYFIDWSKDRAYTLSSIFTEYYQTPTNLIDNNIRWVNVIVDMLLPQRATLFGYAVLFTCILLLGRAVFREEKELFLPAALLTGALPMIHTHSFLAMALVSASWLLMTLCRQLSIGQALKAPGKIVLPAFLLLMCCLQFVSKKKASVDLALFFNICVIGLAALTCFGLWCLVLYIRKNGWRTLLPTWGLYLALTLILSLPQLFTWTFVQASSGGFNKGHFNWANLGDNYLWFYIKNWGIILLLLIPALIHCSRKNFEILSGAVLIWFVVELIAISPNTYDNNKLLYVAYLFFSCIAADFGYNLFQQLKSVPGRYLWSCVFLFLAGISAVLSMGREIVSDYTVYSNTQINVARFIDETLPADAVILTNSRHVNEAAALAGRNIVNGSAVYLGPHGIYNETRVQDVISMYESPEISAELFQKYHVGYIMISSWERSDYAIDSLLFSELFDCVWDDGEIQLYKVKP